MRNILIFMALFLFILALFVGLVVHVVAEPREGLFSSLKARLIVQEEHQGPIKLDMIG